MDIEELRSKIWGYCRENRCGTCPCGLSGRDTCFNIAKSNWDQLNMMLDAFEKAETPSTVDHPEHYNRTSLEAIDGIKGSMTEEAYKGFLKGNVLKYIWRYEHKGSPVEDLKKRKWYLEKLIEEEEK